MMIGSGPLVKIGPKAFTNAILGCDREDWGQYWVRYDIYEKVAQRFPIIGRELHEAAVLAENVYNMDETGVL